MHVARTLINTRGQGTVEVRDLRGPIDPLAWLVAEDGCRHGADGQGFCWVAPPRWMWWVGAPDRNWSLGGAIWHLGQWAHCRAWETSMV